MAEPARHTPGQRAMPRRTRSQTPDGVWPELSRHRGCVARRKPATRHRGVGWHQAALRRRHTGAGRCIDGQDARATGARQHRHAMKPSKCVLQRRVARMGAVWWRTAARPASLVPTVHTAARFPLPAASASAYKRRSGSVRPSNASASASQHLTPEASTTMAPQRARAQLRATSSALSAGMASTAQSTGPGRLTIPGYQAPRSPTKMLDKRLTSISNAFLPNSRKYAGHRDPPLVQP